MADKSQSTDFVPFDKANTGGIPASMPIGGQAVVMSAKQHDKELGSYFDATRQGIEPISTKTKDIQAAVRLSNDTGVAFNGNNI